MLAVARVCGRDRAAALHRLQQPLLDESLLDPTSSLQVQIFTYTMSPYEDWHAQAWAAALVLVAIVRRPQRRRARGSAVEAPHDGRRRRTASAVPASPTEAPAKMRAEELSAWFGDKRALREITLPLVERKVTAVIGPSGCGKSTFIRCLNRMHEVVPGARDRRRRPARRQEHLRRATSTRSACAAASAWCSRSRTRFPTMSHPRQRARRPPPQRHHTGRCRDALVEEVLAAGGAVGRGEGRARPPRRRASPAASSSASASRAASRSSPRCSSWTSRARRSTRSRPPRSRS